jgi:hypothetical protein
MSGQARLTFNASKNVWRKVYHVVWRNTWPCLSSSVVATLAHSDILANSGLKVRSLSL